MFLHRERNSDVKESLFLGFFLRPKFDILLPKLLIVGLERKNEFLTPLNVVYRCPHPFWWAYFCPSLNTIQQRTSKTDFYWIWSLVFWKLLRKNDKSRNVCQKRIGISFLQFNQVKLGALVSHACEKMGQKICRINFSASQIV